MIIRNAAMGVGTALLLTFLFVQQEPVDPHQHDGFVGELQRMKQLDAEINRDLLSSRYELLRSYDPFVQKLGEMRKVEKGLQLIPSFVGRRDREHLHQLLLRESEVLSGKIRLVESFKSKNAILKNSVRYFPVLIAEVSRGAVKTNDTQLQNHLANVLRDILLYDLTPHSNTTPALKDEIAVLAKDAVRRPALRDALSSIGAHALSITTVKPEVEDITEELNSLPTTGSIDAISVAYLNNYRQALKVNEIYRIFLFLSSVILLAFGVDRTIDLVKSRAVVEKANQQLVDTNAQLLKAKTAAEAANLAKSTFLSTMSHEIRTPMNAILGYAQLMLRDPVLGTEAKTNLKIIGRSGEHLLGIINDVLDMSKIEAGLAELNPATFDLTRLLEDLGAMFRPRARARALQFEMLIDGKSVPYIVADEGKIRQVLINLLGNAVKFTDRGQIDLHITLEHREANRLWLSARVEDTGPGITDEGQRKLFEPFSQVRSGVDSLKGTGLGLAISRQHARLMGGDVTVSSTPGEGSVFRFDIPIERGDAGVTANPITSRRVISIVPGTNVPRILVVDDRIENRDWLMKLLTSIGFVVRGADNGKAAIQDWKQWNPQLILMDVHMPVMDGLEATRKIKADPRGRETVIVALTASAMDDDRRTASESGIDDFLTKPCQEDELLEKLGNLLNVEYNYEKTIDEEGQPLAEVHPLSAERLGQLPRELIEDLRKATLSGNKRRLDMLILKVREAKDTASARALQELADKYEYDDLTRLLEEVCRLEPSPRILTATL